MVDMRAKNSENLSNSTLHSNLEKKKKKERKNQNRENEVKAVVLPSW